MKIPLIRGGIGGRFSAGRSSSNNASSTAHIWGSSRTDRLTSYLTTWLTRNEYPRTVSNATAVRHFSTSISAREIHLAKVSSRCIVAVPNQIQVLGERQGISTQSSVVCQPAVVLSAASERADAPLTQRTTLSAEMDAPLMNNIDLLNKILSELVKQENPAAHKLYEEFRQYGVDRASNPLDSHSLGKMVHRATQLSADEALVLVRTFSIMLNLVNSAEVHHRNRLTRTMQLTQAAEGAEMGPLPLIEDSIRVVMQDLLAEGRSVDEIYKQITSQKVEIVLTAHPTQVQRTSLLRRYRQVSETLELLERPGLDGFERISAQSDLHRLISAIWGSDEIRRLKPTPQQEAAGGNAILESVLWDAVPGYLRKLDTQCRLTLGKPLPIDCVPIKFSSWIGGDRDGNPNVTPEVTREVVIQQRLRAARLLLRDMHELSSELAISSRFSPAMENLAASITDSHHKLEKYRRVIRHLMKRLMKTARDCEHELASMATSKGSFYVDATVRGFEEVEPILDMQDLMVPLKIMHESLVETGFELVANGLLLDVIRRLAVFGVTLLPLDIREESTRHTEVIDAITRWLGAGSYAEWSEESRIAWLAAELANRRPLFQRRDIDSIGFSENATKTLRTFDTASQLHPSWLGAYVISQAKTASDVLAVMLLQKQFGMTNANGNLMRVVPLFETLNDLTNAPTVLTTLFSIPVYVGAVKNKQEVMVGYSDSAKDAGRLAACWAQYNSQAKMAEIGKRFGIELTFFHGKGGTVGRGGNPSVFRAILSHPPDTILGRFRVTEQGEMITQNFGTVFVAERTLDIYTAAVCKEAFVKHVIPSQKWKQHMETLSATSCDDYRYLVREEPRFVPYFRQATPELELGTLNIGSRPAKRNPKGGIESLRAIPWTFAWTQTRTHLSAWLGVGKGLNSSDLATTQEMYEKWPWFREIIDLISMILSKTDFSISKNYEHQLVDKSSNGGDLDKLGDEIRNKLVETRQAVLAVTKSPDFGGAHVALMRASSTIRHPYVDPINVIQAELLKRYRVLEKRDDLSEEELETKEVLKDALVISINGIAQGMKNSG